MPARTELTDYTVAFLVAIDVRGSEDDPALIAMVGRMQKDISDAVSRSMFTPERQGVVQTLRVTPILDQSKE